MSAPATTEQASEENSVVRNQEPQINSLADLLYYGASVTLGADGSLVWKHTYVAFLDDEDFAFFGQPGVKIENLTPQVIKECLQPIPDDKIYPIARQSLTVFTLSTEGLYVKRPPIMDYEGTDGISRLFASELEAYELLLQHPHQNIVRYYGCIVKRHRVVGIVMDRYFNTLELRIKAGSREFDKQSCMEGIESALHHLHSLGLAHNDLKPANIMLDENERPILIDFASCKPFGSQIMERGTAGWVDDPSGISELRHDEFALGKIRSWMDDECEA